MGQSDAYDALSMWGVHDIAQAMQWQFQHLERQSMTHWGFSYPLFDVNGQTQQFHGQSVRRWKNALSDGYAKNLWIPKKPAQCLPFYFSPYVMKAVSKQHGRIYIIEGEKDVLTMIAAGFHNAFTWVDGGNNMPESTISVLKYLGVNEVIHLPDLDDVGMQSARKLHHELSGTGIAYRAIELPNELGHKGDVNDLWRLLNFNKTYFQKTVDDLIQNREMQIQSVEKIRLNVPRHYPEANSESWFSPQVRWAIEQALGVSHYKRNGWSMNILCPFHHDEKPSAGWHQEKCILKCQVCNPPYRSYYLGKEVAEHFGIDWKANH